MQETVPQYCVWPILFQLHGDVIELPVFDFQWWFASIVAQPHQIIIGYQC